MFNFQLTKERETLRAMSHHLKATTPAPHSYASRYSDTLTSPHKHLTSPHSPPHSRASPLSSVSNDRGIVGSSSYPVLPSSPLHGVKQERERYMVRYTSMFSYNFAFISRTHFFPIFSRNSEAFNSEYLRNPWDVYSRWRSLLSQ